MNNQTPNQASSLEKLLYEQLPSDQPNYRLHQRLRFIPEQFPHPSSIRVHPHPTTRWLLLTMGVTASILGITAGFMDVLLDVPNQTLFLTLFYSLPDFNGVIL